MLMMAECGKLTDSKLLPLNSCRLLPAHLWHIAEALRLPTTGSTDEVRQLIKGTLQMQGKRDVINVQVEMEKSSLFLVKTALTDEDSVFLETKSLSLLASYPGLHICVGGKTKAWYTVRACVRI